MSAAFDFRPVFRLSPVPARRRMPGEVRQHLVGNAAEAFQREERGLLHFLRRLFRRATKHRLGILHHLRGEKGRVAGVRRHVGEQRGEQGFEGHDAPPKLGVRHLGHDFFSYGPAFVLDRSTSGARL